MNGTNPRHGWVIVSFADKRTAAIFAGYASRKGISSRLAAAPTHDVELVDYHD